jgi:hypothetical protein
VIAFFFLLNFKTAIAVAFESAIAIILLIKCKKCDRFGC